MTEISSFYFIFPLPYIYLFHDEGGFFLLLIRYRSCGIKDPRKNWTAVITWLASFITAECSSLRQVVKQSIIIEGLIYL